MTDRDTLEQDLDRVLSALEPQEPVGEWDWEPPLGSANPATPASAAPLEPEGEPGGLHEAEEPEDETDEEQDPEDDE